MCLLIWSDLSKYICSILRQLGATSPTSSIELLPQLLNTYGVPVLSAAREVATSPSGCAIRWYAVETMQIGLPTF